MRGSWKVIVPASQREYPTRTYFTPAPWEGNHGWKAVYLLGLCLTAVCNTWGHKRLLNAIQSQFETK